MATEHHSHSHGHSHSHSSDMSTKSLYWAVLINILLTVFQLVGGVLSGSLSLLADALHNLSDAGALVIAAIAAKIAHMPGNSKMTYGYRRAEILGALINSTTLVIVGAYLIFEAVQRYFDQKPIEGWTVIVVAGVALIIDLATAFLTYSGSKHSVNIRAAFIHNISDALASVLVIISGILIVYFQYYWVDLVATLMISAYILYHSFHLIKQCIGILMQSVPPGIEVARVRESMMQETRVKDVHHLHIWQLDDKKLYLEGHVVISQLHLSAIEEIKANIRKILNGQYQIAHSTLEIEISETCLSTVTD